MLPPEQQIIASMVQPQDRVLDLGCGDGELLAHLKEVKQIQGYGLDFDVSNIIRCLNRNVNVLMHDLNDNLGNFDDDAFDVVVMANTLQVTQKPDELLVEMLRIGRACIVTLPNFGHWRCRLQLLWGGRMPVSNHLPHEWYRTPNIHLCTFSDFERLCARLNLKIVDRRIVGRGYEGSFGARIWPNMLGAFGLYRLERS